MIKLIVLGGSALLLLQILVVLVCWRFGAMRSRTVAEPVAEEPPPGPSVWDALDRHLADAPAEVLVDDDLPFGGQHEADVDLSEENEAYAGSFVAWGSQCADLEELARELDGAR